MSAKVVSMSTQPPETLTHLGSDAPFPESPDQAILDAVANPHTDIDYLIRFTCPEFTFPMSVTGQPIRPFRDRLRAGKDADRKQIPETLSRIVPQPRSFSRGLHRDDRQTPYRRHVAEVVADRRLLVSKGRHADRRILSTRLASERRLGSGAWCSALPRQRMNSVDHASEAIRDRALAEGFDAVGFSSPDIGDDLGRWPLEAFLAGGFHGDMGWLPLKPSAAKIRLSLAGGPNRYRARRQLRPRSFTARALGRTSTGRARQCLRICPQLRLPRYIEKTPETRRALDVRDLRLRRQGIRRYGAGSGKTVGSTRRGGLAGQAHQSRLAGIRLLALPRRDLYHADAR